VEERRLFWTSSYFFILTPAYLAWRIWQGLAYIVLGNNAAESFIYVLRKADTGAADGRTGRVSGGSARLTESEA
jgi:hypothetical protein